MTILGNFHKLRQCRKCRKKQWASAIRAIVTVIAQRVARRAIWLMGDSSVCFMKQDHSGCHQKERPQAPGPHVLVPTHARTAVLSSFFFLLCQTVTVPPTYSRKCSYYLTITSKTSRDAVVDKDSSDTPPAVDTHMCFNFLALLGQGQN